MNNISIGGVQPDKNTGAYMPAAPQTGTYQNPTNDFQTKNVNAGNMGFDAPDMTPQAGSFGYNPTASSQLNYQNRSVDTSNGGLSLNGTAPQFDPSQNFISDDALVEKRLTDLLSDDNPYVKLNELKAQQAMNAKGGLNTSMAAGAGRAAAIEAGLDIAKQDANTYAQADLARQSSTYQGGLSQQQGEIAGARAVQDAELAGALKEQEAAQAWDTRMQQGAISGDLKQQDLTGQAEQTRLQGLQQGALAEQQGRITGELNTQQAYYEQQNQQFSGKVQAALQNLKDGNANSLQVFQETVGTMNNMLTNEYNRIVSEASLNAEQRQRAADQMNDINKNLEISLQNILLNENLDSAAKHAAASQLIHQANQTMVSWGAIYGVRPVMRDPATIGKGVDPIREEATDGA